MSQWVSGLGLESILEEMGINPDTALNGSLSLSLNNSNEKIDTAKKLISQTNADISSTSSLDPF